MTDIKKLILVGAGDHGRGTLEIVKACNRERMQFEVIGFLDDDPSRHGRVIDGVPVLGRVDWVAAHGTSELQYVLALASCRAKQQLARRLSAVSFATVCHPSAVNGSDIEIGPGSILAAGVVVAYATRIGCHVTVNLNATIGHDCRIGDYTTIAPGVNIAGHVTLGASCDVSLNATIARAVRIDDSVQVGPGAVVISNAAAGVTLFGNPARRVPALTTRVATDAADVP